ncbi:MAG: response regulator, partial [Opitutaceae bacterium]|nr:response regulator [Opitutaceae bacterium]
KTSENNVGSGIGMEFTKKLVTLLKGTITVKSTLKKGTSFTITLPKTGLKSDNTKVTHQVPIIDSLPQTNKNKDINLSRQSLYTVLIVEDNKEIRGYIKLLLEKKYIIIEANNGIEGLRKLKGKKVDFIISDIVMPLMDGLEFCKQIKNNIDTSHIPFIIISAKTEIKDRLKGHELGIDAYLTKPFNKAELHIIIENLLQKKQEQLNYFGKLLELKNVNPSQYINQIDLHLIAHLQEQVLGNNKKMSVDELAKLLGTSRTQLHRKITSITGMSVTRYINHIRIEKAKILLLETNLHINEIAYKLGFESASYFSRIFKRARNHSC